MKRWGNATIVRGVSVKRTVVHDFREQLETGLHAGRRGSWLGRWVERVVGGGKRDGEVGEGAELARGRLRMTSRWIETAAEMVKLPVGDSEIGVEVVRGMLTRFLQAEMGAAEVRYLPAGLVGGAERSAGRRMMLGMGEWREVAEVILREGVAWEGAELMLAEKAAETAGGVMGTVTRMDVVRTQSLTDALTGLYNRRSLERMLEREVLLASRHGVALSVVVIDVDHFKAANDRYGHAVGDEMLRHVAATIGQTLRRSDLAFRYGGDEFVVVLPQTGLNNAMAAMEKLARAMRASTPEGAAAGLNAPTLSIGVAEWWVGGTAERLLRAADEALYRAKRENRNCVRAYRAAA